MEAIIKPRRVGVIVAILAAIFVALRFLRRAKEAAPITAAAAAKKPAEKKKPAAAAAPVKDAFGAAPETFPEPTAAEVAEPDDVDAADTGDESDDGEDEGLEAFVTAKEMVIPPELAATALAKIDQLTLELLPELHKQVDDICQVDKLTQAAKAAMTEGTAEKVRGFGELGVAGFTHLAASEASFCLLYLSIATKVQLTVHESVAGGDPWAVDADEVRNSGRAFIRQGLPRLTDAIKAAQRAHEKHVHGDADDLSGSSLTVKHSCDDLLVHMAGVDREVTGLEGGFSCYLPGASGELTAALARPSFQKALADCMAATRAKISEHLAQHFSGSATLPYVRLIARVGDASKVAGLWTLSTENEYLACIHATPAFAALLK